MKIIIQATVEDVEEYEGKNGYGCNIKISSLEGKKRQFLSLNTKSAKFANFLEENLQEDVILSVDLVQNNFGTRIGEIFEVNPVTFNS